MTKYLLLGAYDDDNTLEVIESGDKATIRKAFEEHLTNGEADSYYMVKVVIEAHPTFEVEDHGDDDDDL